MVDFWNQRAMMPPATYNIPYSAEEQKEDKVIQALQVVVEVLASFHGTSEAYKLLSLESNILSGLIYRSNYQFRSEKRLQQMKKIEKCLKRNAGLKMLDFAGDLQQCFPGQGVCDFHPYFSNAVYIPSRQMYQHLLVKCVSSAALLGRCASLCLETFLMVRQVLALGHFLQSMAVLAANLSRIWVLCRHLCTKTNVLYKRLISVVENLKPVDTPWLPKEASLPADLSNFFIRRADMESIEDMMKNASLGTEYSEEDEENTNPCDGTEEDSGVGSNQSQVQEDTGKAISRDEEDIGLPLKKGETEDVGLPIKRDRKSEDEGVVIKKHSKNQKVQKSTNNKKRKISEEYEKSAKKKKVDHDKRARKRKLEEQCEVDPPEMHCATSLSENVMWFEDRTPDAPVKKKLKAKQGNDSTKSLLSQPLGSSPSDGSSIKKKKKKSKNNSSAVLVTSPSSDHEVSEGILSTSNTKKGSKSDGNGLNKSLKNKKNNRSMNGSAQNDTNFSPGKKNAESVIASSPNELKTSKKKKKKAKKSQQAQ